MMQVVAVLTVLVRAKEDMVVIGDHPLRNLVHQAALAAATLVVAANSGVAPSLAVALASLGVPVRVALSLVVAADAVVKVAVTPGEAHGGLMRIDLRSGAK